MASLGAKVLRTRWLVRAPIPMFRAGLGVLFGGRLLLLEHVGRTSGEHRYVVLECIERPVKDRVIVASGFGGSSQWYRNLGVDPHCWVSIGTARRRPAVARRLTPDEAREVIVRYREQHPKAYAKLSAVIEESVGRSIDEMPYLELAMSL
ncbi:nitroreductase family deazaflavin-dependent oxidoreductase [Gordonia sp. PP30]|uniref:nitroreductase family deazaflavin-dependent oxidoreductase n=1 Tax=unclassified Gordonia (in: high G+C Gram-positive bacteria) TaxID=2657482 RepID=UPI0020002BFB|nr:nitroreductase family deazaflavin-dependent oxidoreductase [Gordonia sp. PP30]UQE73770.1 nitroreductase family deazaflavin-dependent oxidoreductase [Gordonia sp. PP30]